MPTLNTKGPVITYVLVAINLFFFSLSDKNILLFVLQRNCKVTCLYRTGRAHHIENYSPLSDQSDVRIQHVVCHNINAEHIFCFESKFLDL